MAEHWPCMYKAVGLVPSTSKHLVNSMKALVSIVSYQDTEPGRTKVLSLPGPRFFGKQEDSTSLKLPRVQSKRPRSWDALPSSHKSASTSQQAPLGSQGFSGTSFFFFFNPSSLPEPPNTTDTLPYALDEVCACTYQLQDPGGCRGMSLHPPTDVHLQNWPASEPRIGGSHRIPSHAHHSPRDTMWIWPYESL